MLHYISSYIFIAFILNLNLTLAQTQIRVVGSETEHDKRYEYTMKVLQSALEASASQFGSYSLVNSPKMSHRNSLIILSRNREVDVVSTMTNEILEKNLNPVKFPIFQGSMGIRLFLVRKDQVQMATSAIGSLEELKKVPMIQGNSWTDTKILENNGFKVIKHEVYSRLFELFDNNELRLFPRAIHEIWDELESHPELTVLPGVYIQYPSAMYFFTSKENKEVHDRLSVGLAKMEQDGTIAKLFNSYMSDKYNKAALSTRKRFVLENSLFSDLQSLAENLKQAKAEEGK